MSAPERIKAWVWDLPYPSKHNRRAEWSSTNYPSKQDVTEYLRADTVAARLAAAEAMAEALHMVAVSDNCDLFLELYPDSDFWSTNCCDDFRYIVSDHAAKALAAWEAGK